MGRFRSVVFFFSSRRRHTRSLCDWSSDVCSSDLFRVLNAKAEGGAVAREDLSDIEGEYARAAPFARLSRTGKGYRWSLDPSAAALDAALQPLVESAVSLLTSAKIERLRRCGNSTCYWLFIDETKNHSRRWCEMASCGNVVKVRRHREKARSAAH